MGMSGLNNIEKIYEEFEGMDIPQLREVNSTLVDIIKLKVKQKGQRIMRSLANGDKVEVWKGGKKVWKGEVVEKKRTRVVVKRDFDGINYNVPASMLKKIQKKLEEAGVD